MTTSKPNYPSSRPEQAIMLIIVVIMFLAGYSAGRASDARQAAEQIEAK